MLVMDKENDMDSEDLFKVVFFLIITIVFIGSFCYILFSFVSTKIGIAIIALIITFTILEIAVN